MDRLNELIAKYDAFSVPSSRDLGGGVIGMSPEEHLSRMHLEIEKPLAKEIGEVVTNDDSVDEKTRRLNNAQLIIDGMVSALGTDHERVRLMKAIHAVALARVRGTEEPTDVELGLALSNGQLLIMAVLVVLVIIVLTLVFWS